MKYPDDCKTAKDKTEYLYIAQEALRDEHNANVAKLSTEDMKYYIKNVFMGKSRVICQEIGVNRAKLSKEDKDGIIGNREVVGTKANLIKSKRWTVDTVSIVGNK